MLGRTAVQPLLRRYSRDLLRVSMFSRLMDRTDDGTWLGHPCKNQSQCMKSKLRLMSYSHDQLVNFFLNHRSSLVGSECRKMPFSLLAHRNRSIGPMNGWSAVGGQTNSAYVEGGVDMKDGGMGHTVGRKLLSFYRMPANDYERIPAAPLLGLQSVYRRALVPWP